MRKKQTVRRLDTPLRSDPPAVCLVRGLSHPQPCRIHMLWESTAHHSSNCWRQTQLLCSIGLDSQACTLAMRLTTVHMMRLNDTAMHSLYICTWPYCYWEHTGYLLGTYWVLTGYLLGTYWVLILPTLPYWVLTGYLDCLHCPTGYLHCLYCCARGRLLSSLSLTLLGQDVLTGITHVP